MRLAAQAEVAMNLAAEIQTQNAPITEKTERLGDALRRFRELHGYDFNPKSPRDSSMLSPLLEATGAGMLTWDEIGAGLEAEAENLDFQQRAIEAVNALSAAWHPEWPGQTVLQWIGCEPEELRAAVEQELAVEVIVMETLDEKLSSGELWRCWRCRRIFRAARRPKPSSGLCDNCSPDAGDKEQ